MAMTNIGPLNNEGNRHGYWEFYWANGELKSQIFYS